MMVCCGVIIENGKILMIKKGAGGEKGKWCPPGGMQEINESLEDTCKRELEEEINLKVDVIKKLIFLERKFFDEKTKNIMDKFGIEGIYFFLCKPISNLKNIKISSDAADIKWLSKKEALKTDLAVAAKEFLNRVNI